MSTFPDTGFINGLRIQRGSRGLFISLMSPDRMSIFTAEAKDEAGLPAALAALNERAMG
jgi:hypothetical protein